MICDKCGKGVMVPKKGVADYFLESKFGLKQIALIAILMLLYDLLVGGSITNLSIVSAGIMVFIFWLINVITKFSARRSNKLFICNRCGSHIAMRMTEYEKKTKNNNKNNKVQNN